MLEVFFGSLRWYYRQAHQDPNISFSSILVGLETSAGLLSSSTACTTTLNLRPLNRPRQAGLLVLDQDNLEGHRIISVLFFAICSCGTDRNRVSCSTRQESRYLRPLIRHPIARRSARRDSVEVVIVWASLDSLSPGEEEKKAPEQRAQEITAVSPTPRGFQR